MSRHTSIKLPIVKNQRGFTIIEFMIASLVFSVILVVITSFVVMVSRSYYRGLTASKTQETARAIMNDISRSIQLSDSVDEPAGTGPYYFCAGSRRYVYNLGQQVRDDGITHGLATDNLPCTTAPASFPTTGEQIPFKMRLSNLEVSAVAGSPGLYRVLVRVVYGDDDLINNPLTTSASCKTGLGSQFCAVSELVTVVERRL